MKKKERLVLLVKTPTKIRYIFVFLVKRPGKGAVFFFFLVGKKKKNMAVKRTSLLEGLCFAEGLRDSKIIRSR